MSSYLISVAADGTLDARINESVSAKGDRLLLDAKQQWINLINSQQLPKDEIIKVNGRASLLVSCFLGHELCHLYKAIAAFDPRDNSYTIVKSDSPDYTIGDLVEFKNNQIVRGCPLGRTHPLVRPVKSSSCEANSQERSTFLMEVREDTLKVGFSRKHKANGSQIAADAAARLDELIASGELKGGKLAKSLKEAYKASFTPEYAIKTSKAIAAINNPLLVFDVGGKITDENWVIMSEATHAVILVKTEEEIEQWQKFCEDLNLPVIAIIYSDLNAREDAIEYKDNLLTGTVHYLQRGEDVASRPMIRELAKLLVSLTQRKAITV